MFHTLDGGIYPTYAVFMAELLSDVEAFLKVHPISPTAFGDAALRDRHFVFQLRKGRRVWDETEKKVRDFMSKTAVAMCSGCDLRAEDPHLTACTAVKCPMRQAEAA